MTAARMLKKCEVASVDCVTQMWFAYALACNLFNMELKILSLVTKENWLDNWMQLLFPNMKRKVARVNVKMIF